ncbi:cell surface spherulin 4-like protein [Hyaloscypha variabilis F]|uniref:Cell surface spherulin 4-like protein n=1 Tax=Hyaloscypha variabilis (strain UAMH 11265 / GT02V1 / F) TaxID=1149755 RepID=A0A2J6RFF5_HYAVF|nr:cell surface spherulin 4-like protein [Hyaloscypha variabilis F]
MCTMFSRKSRPPPRSSVLVPLYIYPDPGVWDPLYTAIANHPTLTFILIINPTSGPGTTSLPDSDYSRETPKLNAFPNVKTVGYVSTNWGKRDFNEVLKDISVYSGWERISKVKGLCVRGVFLDETPATFSVDGMKFLEKVKAALKFQPGLGFDPLIIHNPGTISDPRYLASANLTVVFEGSYSTYKSAKLHKSISAFQRSSKLARESTACIIHGVPTSAQKKIGSEVVSELRGLAGSVFVTGLDADYYAKFCEGWEGFVTEMDK